MTEYTYTIFDANPNSSSGTAWPDHQDIEIEADSDEEALDAVIDVMCSEAAGLNPDDGYDVGQLLYAIIWDADGTIVGEPVYRLTADDLGIEEEEEGEGAQGGKGIIKVIAHWDDQDPQNEGWYAMSYDADGERDDSMKIYFPVNVDDFGPDEADELHDALAEAFPGAEIEVV